MSVADCDDDGEGADDDEGDDDDDEKKEVQKDHKRSVRSVADYDGMGETFSPHGGIPLFENRQIRKSLF